MQNKISQTGTKMPSLSKLPHFILNGTAASVKNFYISTKAFCFSFQKGQTVLVRPSPFNLSSGANRPAPPTLSVRQPHDTQSEYRE